MSVGELKRTTQILEANKCVPKALLFKNDDNGKTISIETIRFSNDHGDQLNQNIWSYDQSNDDYETDDDSDNDW